MEQVPAFQLCAIRYTAAAFITFGIYVLFQNKHKPTREELKNAAIAGSIFLGLGTGGVAWALNFVDTGLTALIISAEPLIIVMMMWAWTRKGPPIQTFAGIFIGILGMYLLISQDTVIASSKDWFGLIAIFASMLAWGVGSIFVSQATLPKSQFLNSGIQMLVGGFATLILSFIFQEKGIPPSEYVSITWIGIAFLVLFGSVAAFTAFNYLLKQVSPEKVATNTYVNPIIAMILGAVFREEIITNQSILAACIMLCGVFVVNTTKNLQSA